MEPGPLPPHERTWRHPSELGPTRVDVDESTARSSVTLMALVGGTMVVLAVAAMVVAMTPRPSSGPVALSATTTPITTTTRLIVEPPSSTVAPPRTAAIEVRSRTALLTSFVAFPHAVTPGPQLDVDGTDVADAAPQDDDLVFLRTDAVTYRLSWGEAQQMPFPDGSVVFDVDGELVARVSDGVLLSLVDG